MQAAYSLLMEPVTICKSDQEACLIESSVNAGWSMHDEGCVTADDIMNNMLVRPEVPDMHLSLPHLHPVYTLLRLAYYSAQPPPQTTISLLYSQIYTFTVELCVVIDTTIDEGIVNLLGASSETDEERLEFSWGGSRIASLASLLQLLHGSLPLLELEQLALLFGKFLLELYRLDDRVKELLHFRHYGRAFV